MSTGLNCKQLVELVTDYLEGKLPEPVRARVDEHLAGCTGCTTYFEQMRQTIRLTGQLREENIDPNQFNDLLNIFRDWNKG
jgi:predicted anti-sigma-YlaC factor YlaD